MSISDIARKLGRRGGLARAKGQTPEQRSELARKGGEAVRDKYGPEHFAKIRKVPYYLDPKKGYKSWRDSKPGSLRPLEKGCPK